MHKSLVLLRVLSCFFFALYNCYLTYGFMSKNRLKNLIEYIVKTLLKTFQAKIQFRIKSIIRVR